MTTDPIKTTTETVALTKSTTRILKLPCGCHKRVLRFEPLKEVSVAHSESGNIVAFISPETGEPVVSTRAAFNLTRAGWRCMKD